MLRFMRLLALLCLLFFSGAIAGAQTVIYGVTDAASLRSSRDAGRTGDYFWIEPGRFHPASPRISAPAHHGRGHGFYQSGPVPLLYVSETQINFQVPSGLAAGTANMYVTRDGGQSAIFQFTVVSERARNFSGHQQSCDRSERADNSTNSDSNPVASGAVLVVYLTGQGPLDNAVPDGTATPEFAALHRHGNRDRHHRRDQRDGPISRTDAGIRRFGPGEYPGTARSPPPIIRW